MNIAIIPARGGSKCIFDGGLPVILPRWRVQDIDSLEDWKRAEYICNSMPRFSETRKCSCCFEQNSDSLYLQ